jgi:glucose/arabinose dehydrogenase
MKKIFYILLMILLVAGCSPSKIETEETTGRALPYEIEVIAENLKTPWAIAIDEDENIYFTERTGLLNVIEKGEEQPKMLMKFESPFITVGEGGLLGLALDPGFSTNRFLYVYYTYEDNQQIFNRVVRLIKDNNQVSFDRVILDKIPGGNIHNGGRLKIGPDKKLYITVGDTGKSNLAQDLNSLAGKILRIELDGSIPTDNPFANSPIYSYGHRNPQGISWDSKNRLFEAEHGQSAHDEINLIQKGANYGWPIVQGDQTNVGAVKMVQPIIHSGEETWAPSGLATINQGPWSGKLVAGNLAGQQLLVLSLNGNGTSVTKKEVWLKNQYGRIREVIQAKDGSIYFTTSNMDGRGTPNENDDKIIRLVPKKTKETF